MKVFLLNPLFEAKRKHAHFHRDWCGGEVPTSVLYPPLDLASTAALLQHRGIQTILLDASAMHINHKRAVALIKEQDPDFVGIPSAWGSLEDDLLLAARVKQALPKTKIVFSGPNVTVNAENVLLSRLVDYVILGELEETFLNLVTGNLNYNIAYADGGKIIFSQRKLIEDLDSLPFAARSLLPNKRYKTPFVKRNPFTLIMSSRGCPYKCNFCQAKIWYLNKMRFRSVLNVIDELEEIVKVFRIPQVIFRDLTLTVHTDRITAICEEILKRNLNFSWRCFSCVDTVDSKILALMRRSGCHQISYGIESGSQKVLDLSEKGTTLEQCRRAVSLTKKAGIEVCCDFMLGMHGDNKTTLAKTINFALELNPDFAQFQIATPIYSTKFYEYSYGARKMQPDVMSMRWYKCNFSNPQFPRGFLDKQIKTAYKRFYFRPAAIKRQITRMFSHGNFISTYKTGVDFLSNIIR